MKKLLILMLGFVLIGGCSQNSKADNTASEAQQVSVNALVQEAEASYARYLTQLENNQDMATEKVATDLRKRDGLSEVRILSPGRLLLLFSDGNELLMMLGQQTL